MKKLLMGLIFALLIPTGVDATTFYVATNGSDSNSCTQAQNTSTPKRNIMGSNGGLSCLVAAHGDTLDIRAGTYAESLTTGQAWPSGTSYANAATVKAHAGETVTIKPNSSNGIALSSPAAYIIFDRLIVDGSSCSGCNELAWIGEGAHHIRFTNAEIRNNPNGQNLVQLNSNSSFVEFIGGSVHDSGGSIGGNGYYGFYISGKDHLIDGVRVYNCVGYGIHIYVNTSDHPGASPDRNTVRNSEVYSIVPVRSGSSATGILLSSGNSNSAYNNIIRDISAGSGIDVAWGAANTKVYNNTVTRNSFGITSQGINGILMKNNILYNNTSSNYTDWGGTSNASFTSNLCNSSGSGCSRVGNPQFVDAANNNYRLQSGSLAIDTGTTLTDIPAYDMNGGPRPQGTAWDIGVYEGPAPPTNLPTPPTNLVVVSQQ